MQCIHLLLYTICFFAEQEDNINQIYYHSRGIITQSCYCLYRVYNENNVPLIQDSHNLFKVKIAWAGEWGGECHNFLCSLERDSKSVKFLLRKFKMADLDFGGNLLFKMALLAIAPGKLVGYNFGLQATKYTDMRRLSTYISMKRINYH